MIKKYEDACREAGLSEEKIHKIRAAFDKEKKKLKRLRENKNKQKIAFVPLSDIKSESDDTDWDIADDFDLEMVVINNLMLEKLRFELSLLEKADRDFILMCFDSDFSIVKYARKKNIPFQTLQGRRDRLVQRLRKKLMFI